MSIETLPQGIRPFVIVQNAPGPKTLTRRPWTLFCVQLDAAAPFTVLLPANPQKGDLISVTDSLGTAATHTITVDGNGKTISGLATASIATNYGALELQYDTVGWIITSAEGASSGVSPYVIIQTAAGPLALARRAWTMVCVQLSVPALFTVQLPAAPQDGDIVSVTDDLGDAGTHAITVDGNGETINGAASQTISTNYGALELQFGGAGWVATNASTGGGSSITSGTYAARPAAGTVGAVYICTDSELRFYDNGVSWSVLPPTGPLSTQVPNAASWTRVAQTTLPTVTDSKGRVVFAYVPQAGPVGCCYASVPYDSAKVYTANLAVTTIYPESIAAFIQMYGIALIDAGGAIRAVTLYGTSGVLTTTWTDAATRTSFQNTQTFFHALSEGTWWKVAVSGGNYVFSFSYDGVDWYDLPASFFPGATLWTTASFTATKIALFAEPDNFAASDNSFVLRAWNET